MIGRRLQDASEAELLAALEQKRAINNAPPEPLSTPDFSGLISMVQDGVTRMAAEQYQDDDFDHYVYEAAMEAIYGKSYWRWRNSVKWK